MGAMAPPALLGSNTSSLSLTGIAADLPRRLVAEGNLGKKSGQGLYEWVDGEAVSGGAAPIVREETPMPREVLISGLTAEELLDLSDDDLAGLVFCDEPLLFRMGTAEILGEFRLTSDAVVLELATIDAGGEGVLPALASLARRYARSRGLPRVEWIVHAINCADPNLKLRRVLERGGFVVERVHGSLAYHRIDDVEPHR